MKDYLEIADVKALEILPFFIPTVILGSPE